MTRDITPVLENDSAPASGARPTERSEPQHPLWLRRHRIAVPGRSPGYLHRPALAELSTPTAQRVTLLLAPGGFGKTALLAECCRDQLECGVPVAWLTLDGGDEPEMLDTYLAYAVESAGLGVLEPLRSGAADTDPPTPRTELLLRAIEAHGEQFVLVLDEAEQLTQSALVTLVNILLRGAPPNLHIAIAGRELPVQLDVSTAVLDSDAQILTADDLRFTREDIASFYDHKLSRRELSSVVSMSAGWPITLRIGHNESPAGFTGDARVVQDVIGNWVETRLWYSLADDQRELLRDVGLFERFDAALLDDALGIRGAILRLEALRAIDGLLEPGPKGAAETWQLHPLIRAHCARWRRRETPARYRRIHGNIGRTLARRGQTIEAMRHAVEADDVALLSNILLDAGGIRLALREGSDRLAAAHALLPDDAIARHPRLTTARCLALATTGHLADARRVLASIPGDPPSARSSGDFDLRLDRCLARAMIAHYGCESARTTEAPVMDLQRIMEMTVPDPVVQCATAFALCAYFDLRASFDRALDHGLRLRRLLRGGQSVLAPLVDIQFGLIAMAQGRTHDAQAWYSQGQRLAKARSLPQPRQTVFAKILILELDLERNRIKDVEAVVPVPGELRRGAQLAVHFATTDIALEMTQATRGLDEALSLLDHLWSQALQIELPALVRHLAALRVSLLADAGRGDEAQRTWTAAALPDVDAGCIDLNGQSWREVESVSCARLRLLTARCQFDAGRRLGRSVLRVATERGLKRTAMRVLILCLKLEHRSSDDAAAVAHLGTFLELFVETDYARALLREGEIAKEVLERFLQTHPDSALRNAAEGLLAAVRADSVTAVSQFTVRQLEVLRRLETKRDDDIAAELGISRFGIRYHVGHIFGKLKVHTRREAVRRARALGILPPAE